MNAYGELGQGSWSCTLVATHSSFLLIPSGRKALFLTVSLFCARNRLFTLIWLPLNNIPCQTDISCILQIRKMRFRVKPKSVRLLYVSRKRPFLFPPFLSLKSQQLFFFFSPKRNSPLDTPKQKGVSDAKPLLIALTYFTHLNMGLRTWVERYNWQRGIGSSCSDLVNNLGKLNLTSDHLVFRGLKLTPIDAPL